MTIYYLCTTLLHVM